MCSGTPDVHGSSIIAAPENDSAAARLHRSQTQERHQSEGSSLVQRAQALGRLLPHESSVVVEEEHLLALTSMRYIR